MNLDRTLVIAPHPDDELLGCGGTLLRRKSAGHTLGWLIVTGMTKENGWSDERIKKRDKEIQLVASRVGFDKVYCLKLCPARLDEMGKSDLVSRISEVFSNFSPTELFMPHRGDVHSDHRVVFDVVSSCTKWFRYGSVKRVFTYETPSETEFGRAAELAFKPNYFVNIEAYLEAKLQMLSIYESEMHEFPFPRSYRAIQALAEWRGANSGYEAAEAFELLLERE